METPPRGEISIMAQHLFALFSFRLFCLTLFLSRLIAFTFRCFFMIFNGAEIQWLQNIKFGIKILLLFKKLICPKWNKHKIRVKPFQTINKFNVCIILPLGNSFIFSWSKIVSLRRKVKETTNFRDQIALHLKVSRRISNCREVLVYIRLSHMTPHLCTQN